SRGFLGEQCGAMRSGKNEAPELKDGDEVICREPFNLQEVARSALGFIQRIDETVKKLDSALARGDQHVLSERTLTNFAVAVSNFRLLSARTLATLDTIDGVVQSNTFPVSATASNLVLFSL